MFAMLPKEAEYSQSRNWQAKASAVSRLVDVNFVLSDMIAKATGGTPARRAMAWGEGQVRATAQARSRGGPTHSRKS
jgi:hypothetical protein